MEEETKCYCGHTITCDCGPLEETKQETLEEVAERLYPNTGFEDDLYCDEGKTFRELWLAGAKWQQERMYSEEDMEIAFGTMSTSWISFEEFIEQFKKK